MTAKRKLWLLLLALISAVLLPLALPNEFIGGAIRKVGLAPGQKLLLKCDSRARLHCTGILTR